MPEFEQPPQPNQLPIVTAEMIGLTIVDMGGEKSTFVDRQAFSENVFGDLLNSKKDFVQMVNDVLAHRITHQDPQLKAVKEDDTLEGMAIVLKAFDHMKEFDLIPRFTQLKPDDIDLAKRILEESIPSQERSVTILQRLLNLPRIPEQQVSLSECLRSVGKKDAILSQREIFSGGSAMYKILEALWPKLYPPQTPSPASS